MSINKIYFLNFNNFQTRKSNKPQLTDNPIKKINLSNINTNGLNNISFGQKIAEPQNFPTFDDSLNRYFRLKPDMYQKEAAHHIFNGEDTLVLAPTGTGKTLIAEYAINKNLQNGKTTYYTTPLKALSNEKYTDFCKLFGKENVGLLTGEIKINPQAPIVIMTTEIYRNMLVGEEQENLNERLKDVTTVIYDEFHYMNEPERGEVWETSIMYTPPSVQQLLLSATAENGTTVQKWMNRLLSEKGSTHQAQIVNVPSEERHVPLKFYVYDNSGIEKIIPLMQEKYNLPRLGKALNPDSKTNLTGKQREVLSDISLRINTKNALNDEVSPEKGLSYLLKRLKPTGMLSDIENLLIDRLDYSKPEAERAAAILADKNERKLNETLTKKNTDKKKETKKEERKDFYRQNGPQRVASAEKLNSIIFTQKCKHDEVRAIKQLSRNLGGDCTLEDGLQKLSEILRNKDLKIKEFEKLLRSFKLNDKQASAISHMLMVIKYPEQRPAEFDLIKALDKENKLPAIFFKFSKKQCDEMKKKFLQSEKFLLNSEEKEKAAEIIKKHLDKGAFLGTDEDASDLLSGVAVHHAGKMPGYKALVEELAQNKLLKVVFATSTLGAGINVPAKSVVFTQLTHYSSVTTNKDGDKFVDLTPNEFQQMGGRAGRRGKDSIGNVIIMPDKEHGAGFIYNLATAKPDAIISSFKPTYSFISHYIAIDGSTKHLAEAVDKSFLQERLESLGIKPYKLKNKIKKEFQTMANILIDPTLKCFEDSDGDLVPTIKGDIVSKARGVDGLLFAETLYKAGLEYLEPEEMVAVACALTPADERDIGKPVNLSEMTADVINSIDALNKKLNEIQQQHGLSTEALILNRFDAQKVTHWAKLIKENDEKSNEDSIDTRQIWENVIKKLKAENPAFCEGDLLKSVNNTIDILEQIKEVADYASKEYLYDEEIENAEKMKKIKQIANKSLELIKRDPISYEL